MSIGLPLTIPNSFARTARWFGNSEAVVDSVTRLTYAELDLLSRRAAALFASLGALPGEPLALLCPPSAIYLVAWLSAVRLGALPMALHTRESAATLAAETYVKTTEVGMQVMGGYGYNMEFDMQRHFRDARAATIAAGTSQIQRNLIAGQMGLKVQ